MAIDLIDIHKRFGLTTALDGVSLRLERGSVHGLLGENGAGKTTIMNVLYGLVRPDSGQIRMDGRPAAIRSPADAIAMGIGMVHQHFMLAGQLTVLDNILLGDRRQSQFLSRRQASGRLIQLAGSLGWEVDPAARIEELSVGQQQRVEILKALYRDIDLLILDEPTAVLTPQETDNLLSAMSRLRDAGKAVVFISHKLAEVQRICDRLTILRRGRVAWEGPATAGADELAARMVGEEHHQGEQARLPVNPKREETNRSILKLESVRAEGLAELSLTVGAEVLGIAGVDGNGQQELAELLVGLRSASSGRIMLGGEDVTALGLAARNRLGIAHIPNDRKLEALVPSMSIAQNIALKHHGRRPFSRSGIVNWARVHQSASELAGMFDVRASSVDTPVATLSGGNQQKVVLARELAVVKPRAIVAMNPTRGLDIAATRFVHERLIEHRNAGCAVIVISSELDELLTICDRLAVLYRGRLTETSFPHTDTAEIGRLMAGLGAT